MDISFSALDGALGPSSPPISCLCVTVAALEEAASRGLIPNLQSEGLEGVPNVARPSLSAYTSVQDRPRYPICSPWPMLRPHLAGNNPRLLHSALLPPSSSVALQMIVQVIALAVMPAKTRDHSATITYFSLLHIRVT